MRASGAQLGVVVAFGQLLPVALLEALPLGFVNVHFSLLPRWRGAAPVERAILAGDAETGVCVMQLEAGLDTGPVYASQTRSDRRRRDRGRAARASGRGRSGAARRALAARSRHDVPVPQRGEPTYAEKLTVDEFRLDPARPAIELDRLVRAGQSAAGRVDARRRPAREGLACAA